jgi:Protein of unknown function (DUF3365)
MGSRNSTNLGTLMIAAGLALSAGGCGKSAAGGITPQVMADGLHAVMAADRTIYTRNVVNRLQNDLKIIKATEHWQDEKTLPLPAQMFRMGAELASKEGKGFTYALLSLWPVNKQNAPRTEVEKKGLQYVVDNPGKNYYADEDLGGTKYFTAVYADKAVAPACVSCHNNHEDSPRTDFKLDDIMGGVVIRVALR